MSLAYWYSIHSGAIVKSWREAVSWGGIVFRKDCINTCYAGHVCEAVAGVQVVCAAYK